MAISPTLSVMIRAADKAAKSLVRDFGEVEKLQISMKGPGDFVSNADKKAESIIIEELSKARPDYAILAEESGEIKKNSEYRFVIDPLDGTTNFLHGFPYWSISIALERNGEPIAGVISAPILNETFWAEKGQGAFVNNRRIRTSGRRHLNEAFIASGSPSSVRRVTNAPFDILDAMRILSRKVGYIRCVNSAALDLAFIAAGRFDALVDLSLKKWDIAAGIIILKEAGGQITDVFGKDSYYEKGDVIASNYHLHDNLISLLSAATGSQSD